MKQIIHDIKRYETLKHRVSLIASLPIVLVAICLIGDIFIQTTLQFSVENGFSKPLTAGLLSSFSSLSLLLTSNSRDLQLTSSLGAGIDVIYAIAMILLSSKAIKGNIKSFYGSALIYLVDFVLLIPVSIISALKITIIQLQIIDYILLFLIHIIGLAILGYGCYLQYQITRYEKEGGNSK